MRDALRNITPARFNEERVNQQTPHPLAQIFAILGDGQCAVKDLYRRTRLLNRIFARCFELDEFDGVRMRKVS